MNARQLIEIAVGFFVLAGIASLVMLAFKVSGLRDVYNSEQGYQVYALFDNIGNLKARSRVTIAGVNVGRVKSIELDETNYRARVDLFIKNSVQIPTDSGASILTAGLIGDNYIALEPGAEEKMLKEGDVIQETHSALILERLIGQFLFNEKK